MTTSKDSKGEVGLSRREILKYSAGTLGSVSLTSLTFGCASVGSASVQRYPIDSKVATTAQRMISFPMNVSGLAITELDRVAQYSALGYGQWAYAAALPVVQRTDIMRTGYSNPSPARNRKFVNFFAFTDIHITDKEAPNQLIYMRAARVPNRGAFGQTVCYIHARTYRAL